MVVVCEKNNGDRFSFTKTLSLISLSTALSLNLQYPPTWASAASATNGSRTALPSSAPPAPATKHAAAKIATVLLNVTSSCRPRPEEDGRKTDSTSPGRTRRTSSMTAWAAWYLTNRGALAFRTMPRYRPKNTTNEASGREKYRDAKG